ncbi:SRPBCC family protein [Halorussus halophilus]|uniref:SRPBCC family protein n=1 Tax=Halorussus halophilus TaxID=2650975 RepID=UPI001300F5F5|nr:SRPBCC family protein [Halorussus halophilus]
MRQVEVSKFVAAPPVVVQRELTPTSVVEFEGSFEVQEVTKTEAGAVVTASAGGLTIELVFEDHETGLTYRQRGETGPFDAMETTVSVVSENEGSRVTTRSEVSLGLPVAGLTDRVAAWKRRGELERSLDRLAEQL